MVINRLFLPVAIGILLLISCVHAAPGTNGLVVYYNGTLSGNSVVDLSGNENNGNLMSATQGTNLATGAYYLNLNSSSSKIEISKNKQTDISNPITIEFIGSINEFSQYEPLVSKYTSNSNGWFLCCSSDAPYNHVRFGAVLENSGENSYESNTGLVAGQVYDIVATYDSNKSYIYINGVDSGSSTWDSPMAGNTNTITIGSVSGLAGDNSSNNISMYDFRLYNRALTSAEVLQNYNNWRNPYDNIKTIKKMVYGDGGLPRYMGSYAIQPSDSGLNILDNNLNTYGSVGTPFFWNNGGSLTNCSLAVTTINGIRWKNDYAPGSSAVLTYTGDNRNVQDTCLLSDTSFDLTHSVTYSGQTQTVQDGVPVNGGSAYEYYGDGLNTINGNDVLLYTDNGMVQSNLLWITNNTSVTSTYQTRNAGVTRTSSLDLPLSSPQLTPMPVPSGYLGALIFAEHADNTDHNSIRTLMYGTNNTTSPIYGTKGFIGHNLNATWSVFALSTVDGGEGLDNSEFKSVTDEMYYHGFEIIPHSLSGTVNTNYPSRTMAETYLPWFVTNYSCRNWIDHGLANGAKNVELKSEGWNQSSPYYIMDLFQQYNIPYAWSFVDAAPDDDIGISTSKSSSVGLPVDIIWQNTNLAFPNGTPLYQWKSCAAGEQEALNWYTNSTIDKMLSTYGISIWHDYWADDLSKYSNYYYTQGQPEMINETFDHLLNHISAQKQAGKLWNPTVSQYIDYWIAARNVEVRCTGVNTYTVVNHNSGPINGFAMRVTGSYTPKLDGMTLNTKSNGDDVIFWMDLPTGTHTITLGA